MGVTRLEPRWPCTLLTLLASTHAARGGRTPRDAAKEDYRHALQAKRYA